MKRFLCVIVFSAFSLWGYTQDFCVTVSSGKTLCFDITSSKTVRVAKSKTIQSYFEYFDNNCYCYKKDPIHGYVFEGSLVIPATVTDRGDTYKVTNVGELSGTNLTFVKLPETVTSISWFAFSNSEKLTTIILSDSLKYIGRGAFKGCSMLSSITFSSTVESIDESAFSGCENLQNITLPPLLETIKGHTFSGCSNLQSVTLPTSIKKIEGYAFSDCISLREIEIPEGTEKLSCYAFSGCKRLRTIKLPDSLLIYDFYYDISEYKVFSHCPSLEKIIIPIGTIDYYKHMLPGCADLFVEKEDEK